ncbi:hypothetical protein BGI41_02960 [Methanobrevibacter sp. 87.7]|uniref:hypothetical protein n=1 Tax=Methanobrevibacter sp. 87.7 TaxID=387957 RepID=UPI000B5061AD|nr:hypothetical protein [Methanobrevibacter sp. 87.7]OWT33332.1 hypothetical protein BGI41_02960 [Methanobrevibacter sp. 87.7]
MKYDNYYLAGIILIIFGALIYFTSFLDLIIRPLFQPLLMGSSKGKDVLYFVIFGIFLIFSRYGEKHNLNWFNKSNDFYLKLSLVLILVIGVIGILTEVYIRLKLNLPLETTFVVVEPKMTTTSIQHSHVFKSVFGSIIVLLIKNIPSSIHVGNSLAPYIPNLVKYCFVLVPILFITMIKSVENRSLFPKLLLIFLLSLGIIGIMDGGLFATPTIAGIYGILIIMFNEYLIDNVTPVLTKNKESTKYLDASKQYTEVSSLKDNISKDLAIFRDNISQRKHLKYYFKIALPHLILILIIILRFSFVFACAQTAYYEVDILEPQDNIDLNEYGVLSVKHLPDRDIYYLSSNHNEMKLLNSLDNHLNGTCKAFTISWNPYSYF